MIRRFIRGFGRDESGAVFVQVALVLTALCGAAGLAIDVGAWYASERKMQAAGDAAAIAGAYEALWGGDAAAVAAAAKADVVLNGFELSAATVNSPPSSGPAMSDPSAVEVIIQKAAPGMFSSLIMSGGSVGIVTRSVAGPVAGVPVCMLALESLASKGIHLKGGSALDAQGCMVQANSSSPAAIDSDAGSSLTSEETAVVGDVGGSGYLPVPDTGAVAIADPLAYLNPPTYGACTEPTTYLVVGGTVTLNPGVYCGGIDISGGADVTFNAGTYVIKDGALKAGGSVIHGDEVGFYLTGSGARVDVSSGSQVNFSAPTDGEMAGLVFYQGPDATGTKSEFSASDLSFEGTLYFPDQRVDISNGATSTSPGLFTVLIAKSLHLHEGSSFTLGSDYTSSTVPVFPALGAQRIAIYE